MKKNYILLLIVAFAVLISSMVAYKRMTVESNNKTVDVVLDYNEFEKMAKQSEHDLGWWFHKLKGQGVRAVALNEENFESMMDENKPLKVEMIGNIIKDMEWEKKYPKPLVDYLNTNEIDAYDLLATTNSKELYNFIKEGLESRYDENKFKIINSKDKYMFLLDGTVEDGLYTQMEKIFDAKEKGFKEVSSLYSSKLIRVGLGLDQKKVNLIKNSGLNVVPRPNNYKRFSGNKLVKATIDDYKKFNIKPAYFIFGGSEVLGYPDGLNILEDYMKKNDIKVGMIESGVQREHIEQDGLYELTRNLGYNAVRVFSMADYIQKRFQYYNYKGAEEIENTLFRAVTERNIRVIYFKPFKYEENIYVTDRSEYVKMFDGFKTRIREHEMTLGQASVMESNKVRNRYKILIGWGIVAAGILLLNAMLQLKEKYKHILLGLGLLGVTGIVVVKPSLATMLLALSAAIIFPSLSMAYFCKRCRDYYNQQIKKEHIFKIIGLGIKDLIICSGISAIGALMVGTILSDIEYLLEMSIFRGVKFSQLVPISIFMILYLGYFGYKNHKAPGESTAIKWEDIKGILFDNVKIVYVIVGVVLGVIGYIYMARTGHETNITPSDLEMIFRNTLEEKLFARPRNKEFLFAFPALIMGVAVAKYGYKHLVFIFGLATVIGQTSIVNTFCHLRTPMVLSLLRTGYSLIFGILLGIIYVLVIYGIMKMFRRLRGEKLDG
ncbi:DUF5693 family protein [Marinisporobacter balticus]|uniref:Uncharacterized protein n=1 Tax=Marinisporobacter balticus TaxID=2018667 RepID=A0A4R2KKY1_9FIRM|nr:DUF5693 family protein [Marinisporobacter balticus]TCO73147.1 hypothetical protein EV214_11649 [Marinisporobacter balticus]